MTQNRKELYNLENLYINYFHNDNEKKKITSKMNEVLQKIENSIPFKIIFNKSVVAQFNFTDKLNFNLNLNETVNELSIETDKSILEIEINFFENEFIFSEWENPFPLGSWERQEMEHPYYLELNGTSV